MVRNLGGRSRELFPIANPPIRTSEVTRVVLFKSLNELAAELSINVTERFDVKSVRARLICEDSHFPLVAALELVDMEGMKDVGRPEVTLKKDDDRYSIKFKLEGTPKSELFAADGCVLLFGVRDREGYEAFAQTKIAECREPHSSVSDALDCSHDWKAEDGESAVIIAEVRSSDGRANWSRDPNLKNRLQEVCAEQGGNTCRFEHQRSSKFLAVDYFCVGARRSLMFDNSFQHGFVALDAVTMIKLSC